MTINSKKDGELLIVSPEGRIDSVTAPEFQKVIDENIEGAKNVVIDFSKLEYISSAGLRVLLATKKAVSKTGGDMKLRNVGEGIMDVLNITGFVDILTIE